MESASALMGSIKDSPMYAEEKLRVIKSHFIKIFGSKNSF
jgi:hypothetical protein